MALPWLVRARIKLKTVYKRITLNRLTAGFFIFGFIHCFAQGIMHSFLFTIDAEYNNLLTDIVHAAQVPPRNHTYWDGTHQLVMCDWIPHNDATCSVIFDTRVDVKTDSDQVLDPAARGRTITNSFSSGFFITANSTSNSTNITSVTLFDQKGGQVVLDQQCTSMLLYPQQLLQNYKREDLTWVFFQFWLLAVSLTAMINDSVPHVLAVFCARFVATMWSLYVIFRTQQRKHTFWELIEQPGTPCSIELFSIYDKTRLEYEIPDLILSCSALGIAGYLTWTIHKVYSAQFFGCIGAPEPIARLYKYFMAVQACLQMESFVLMTAIGLWIDQLFNTYISVISEHTIAYKAALITTTVVLVPWIVMGWIAIRRELKVIMAVFLGLTFGLIVGWAIMFYSQVYRWTFIAWPGLGCWTVASFILLILTITLGIVCWRNFGKGLAHYLHAEDALASSNFKQSVFEHDVEKAGISWDPPPLAKVSIKRSASPDDPPAVNPVPTYYLPTLSRTRSHAPEDSITSFASPGSPSPVSPVRLQGGRRLG